jgi:hypothetical protein
MVKSASVQSNMSRELTGFDAASPRRVLRTRLEYWQHRRDEWAPQPADVPALGDGHVPSTTVAEA